MKHLDFPIAKTKTKNSNRKFNLNDPKDRAGYFALKAGKEIEAIRTYLASGKAFVAFLLGKKNSGKGTYSKLFMEAVGGANVGHLSVGDIVRDIHKFVETEAGKAELVDFLKKNYRGFHSPEETIDLILGRNQSSLISSELILALIQFELKKRPRQALFIDGFPRAVDQINYSLFLKQLIGYHNEPDFLVFIDVPESVIDARIRARVICPKCHTPRSLRLAPTQYVGYDEKAKSFYLMCDNPDCDKARMVTKEGDELGIEPIRERIENDDKVFAQLLKLHGVPKIYLRNCLPAATAKDYVDDYEITPSYSYERDKSGKAIEIIESPWIINDDDGVSSHSLLPAAVAVSLIKQVAQVLNII
jgi:adenylate kinase family enzyme